MRHTTAILNVIRVNWHECARGKVVIAIVVSTKIIIRVIGPKATHKYNVSIKFSKLQCPSNRNSTCVSNRAFLVITVAYP